MVKLIKKIGKEQEAEIPSYIRKWVDLASVKIDREKGLSVAKKVFEKDKSLIIYTESLDNTVALIKFCLEVTGKKIGQLDSQLNSQLYSQLDSQLRSQLDSQLYSQLNSQLNSQLYSQLDSQLYSQLDSQLNSQLRSQLDSQLRSQLDSQLPNTNYNFYIAYYWQLWAGYYDYGKSIGVEFDLDKLQEFYDIILNMPICIFVGNIVFICEKPEVLWDADGMIHSEKKPAIFWDYDQTGFYYIHGVKFEKELWEKVITSTMSFSEILKIENTEQRLQAMRLNPNALMSEKPKLIHKSERGNELWLIEGSDVNKFYDAPKVYLLGFIDPSKDAPNNVMYEEVSPEDAEREKDADKINAIHCRLTLAEYSALEYES
jgi:hypothetical protein